MAIIADNSDRLVKTLETDLEAKLEGIVYKSDNVRETNTDKTTIMTREMNRAKHPQNQRDPLANLRKYFEREKHIESELKLDISRPERQRQGRGR